MKLSDMKCNCSFGGPIVSETDDKIKHRIVCCACFTQTHLHKSVDSAKKSWTAGKTFIPAGL